RSSVRWERGFPVEGRLAAQRSLEAYESLVGLRALATLRRLRSIEPPSSVLPVAWIRRFILASPLRGLRALGGLRRVLFGELLRAQPPLQIEELHLDVEGGGGPSGKTRECAELAGLSAAFADGVGLPRLRWLSLSFCHGLSSDPGNHAWLWDTALGRRIETLAVNESFYCVPK